MHRPGVALAISRSQVRRPNHYTTEPPWYVPLQTWAYTVISSSSLYTVLIRSCTHRCSQLRVEVTIASTDQTRQNDKDDDEDDNDKSQCTEPDNRSEHELLWFPHVFIYRPHAAFIARLHSDTCVQYDGRLTYYIFQTRRRSESAYIRQVILLQLVYSFKFLPIAGTFLSY